MPSAEILTIGTELLLGEIVDTNATYIARVLRDHGVNLFYSATVGDNEVRIADAIHQAMDRAEIVITTGGLGPTIDDATRQAVARACEVELEFREELWQQILERYTAYGKTPTENNKRQAFVPQGAIAIKNPVGTAPAFLVKTKNSTVISLPGVPSEMELLLHEAVLPYLRTNFDLQGLIKARVLKTANVGESHIDSLITDLEELHNPTVGLAAHAGRVDIRITAKADNEVDADALIAPVEEALRTRLGEWIYGVDEDTLEQAALQNMNEQDWQLVIVEAGLGGMLTGKLTGDNPHFLGGLVLNQIPSLTELESQCQAYLQENHADVCLGVALIRGEDRQTMHLVRISPQKTNAITRTYGGPPKMAAKWCTAVSLDVLRRLNHESQTLS